MVRFEIYVCKFFIANLYFLQTEGGGGGELLGNLCRQNSSGIYHQVSPRGIFQSPLARHFTDGDIDTPSVLHMFSYWLDQTKCKNILLL